MGFSQAICGPDTLIKFIYLSKELQDDTASLPTYIGAVEMSHFIIFQEGMVTNPAIGLVLSAGKTQHRACLIPSRFCKNNLCKCF